MNKEFDIDNLISGIDFNANMLTDIGNGLLLTNEEISVLNNYKIEYKNCSNLNQIVYLIEEYLEVEENEDLDYISKNIAERNYYVNTNK